MRIQTCTLRNVRGLSPLHLDFTDPVSGRIRERTVIAGSNGSGKTTLLEAIGQLLALAKLQNLDWIRFDQATVRLSVEDLPPGTGEYLLVEITPNFPQARVIQSSESNLALEANQKPKASNSYVELYEPAQLIYEQIQKAEKGEGTYPNCIYFPSENRQLQKKQTGQIAVAEPISYQWVVRFTDSQQWPGSLESFLVAMYFRDLMMWNEDVKQANRENGKMAHVGEFEKFVRVMNRFLIDKQISGVNRQTFRLQVQTNDGQINDIDHLSSGEKQIVLLLGELQRRIQKGSVVLIDEPEIHLHPQWQRQLVQALTDLCQDFDAQLILTTHSEEIAEAVSEHELILLDDIFTANRQSQLHEKVSK